MKKSEVEELLEELDEALVQAFPGPEPMSVLLVGGACLLLQGIATRPIESVDVIFVELMGSGENTLVFYSPIADKVRRIIKDIGKRNGLKGERQLAYRCFSDEKSRIDGQRVIFVDTFPTALLRTWRAPFRCTTLSRDQRLFNATPALVLWPIQANQRF